MLDREQAGANAEFVKTEFEKAVTEVQHEFTDQARTIAEFFEDQFAAVFGEQDGQLAKELERRFGDGSAASVQNRVREAVQRDARQVARGPGAAVLAGRRAQPARRLQGRRDARRSSQAAERSARHPAALLAEDGRAREAAAGAADEKEKLEEVEAERERGTAKGRSFEEAVAEAVDAIALAQGDVAEAVGDLKEATGKTGDVVVAIDACNGPARGRIVIEAKDRRLSKPKALEELDRAIAERERRLRRAGGAHRGGGAGEAGAAARVQRRQAGGRARPRRRARCALELALPARAGPRADEALGRRRHRRRRACATTVERALAALDDERKIKSQLTGAKTRIDKAYELVEEMAARVRAHLQEIDALVRPADERRRGSPRRSSQLEL